MPSHAATHLSCKPSEKDPSVSLLLAELVQKAGVPGWRFQCCAGDRVAADRLLEHSRVKAISFVGSTPICQNDLRSGYEQRQAGPGTGRREEPHGGAPRCRHRHGGGCRCFRRIRFFWRTVYGDFRRSSGERCRGAADRCRQRTHEPHQDRRGFGNRKRNGALDHERTPEQSRIVHWMQPHIRERRSEVGWARTSGGCAGRFFLGTSLIDHVKPGMSCYEDEIFGPVLAVMRVDTYDEALRVINENPYANGTVQYSRATEALPGSSSSMCGSRHGGRQRTSSRARGVLQFRLAGRLRSSAICTCHRRPEGVRFYARQGRDEPLAGPRHKQCELGIPAGPVASMELTRKRRSGNPGGYGPYQRSLNEVAVAQQATQVPIDWLGGEKPNNHGGESG